MSFLDSFVCPACRSGAGIYFNIITKTLPVELRCKQCGFKISEMSYEDYAKGGWLPTSKPDYQEQKHYQTEDAGRRGTGTVGENKDEKPHSVP